MIIFKFRSQTIKLDLHYLQLALLIILALVLRIVLIQSNWPLFNSDEAIMNLMATHINTKGTRPIFFYGQNYMGALEAYLGALTFNMFGTTVNVLRISMLLFYGLFLISMYILVRQLYNRGLALFTILLFCFGTRFMLRLQFAPIGGYPEITFLGASIFAIAVYLAASSHVSRLLRTVLYGLWGCLVGLALWDHLVVAPYILVSAFLLCIFCWRDIGAWLMAIPGLLLGASPLLYYNIDAPPNAKIWVTFINISGSNKPVDMYIHLRKAFLIAFPTMTGYQPVNLITSIQYQSFSHTPKAFFYMVTQNMWSIGLVLLCIIAILISLKMLKETFSKQNNVTLNAIQKRRIRALESAKILLIVAAILTTLLFMRGNALSIDSLGGSRYLICIWITIPVLIGPLWLGIDHLRTLKFQWKQLLAVAKTSLLLFILAVFVNGYIDIVRNEIPKGNIEMQKNVQLLKILQEQHITHFYTDYWSCYTIAVLTHEKSICATVGSKLELVDNRYDPYVKAVTSQNDSAYVFKKTADAIKTIEKKFLEEGTHYQRFETDTYYIYKKV